jgi:hypothetical protein
MSCSKYATLAWSAAFIASCHACEGFTPCLDDADCGAERCVRSYCAVPCDASQPCDHGAECVNGACVVGGLAVEGEGEGVSHGEGEGEGEGEGSLPDAGCVDEDGDGVGVGCVGVNDCDDHDARVFPGHPEECDGLDNDCNGVVDDGDVCGCISLRVGDDKDPRQWCLLQRSYEGARSECARRGYRLAQIRSAAELGAIEAALFDHGIDTWIGVRRSAPNQSTFVFDDGTALGFDAFQGNEPDNPGGNEDCVTLVNQSYNTDQCAKDFAFLCEPAPAAVTGACVDADHDGRGAGCAKGADCDDNNASVFALVGGVEDHDQDGTTSSVRELACTDGSRPAGLVASASSNVDCDDTNGNVQANCGVPCFTVAGPDAGPAISLCTDDNTFDNANSFCGARFNNHLVSIHDQDTQDVVSQLSLGRASHNVWIGLQDEDANNVFDWEDGQALATGDFNAFQPDEPKDATSGKHCVDEQFSGWSTDACTNTHPSICR